MKKLLKMMKSGDIVLLLFLVVLSFLPVIIFSFANATSATDYYTAVVSVDGEEIHRFELKDDGEREVYVYSDDHGHENHIIREGTIVYMVEASCADQLCVRQGEIERIGETIVCLPHRLLVEVNSDNVDQQPDTEIDVIS